MKLRSVDNVGYPVLPRISSFTSEPLFCFACAQARNGRVLHTKTEGNNPLEHALSIFSNQAKHVCEISETLMDFLDARLARVELSPIKTDSRR